MPSMMNLEGPLSKWTNIINGWQFRWFVLDADTGLLSYYTTKENMSKGERRGCIRLHEAFVGYDNEDDITFTITVGDKTFHLQARNQDEREEWVSKIERAIRMRSNKLQLFSGQNKSTADLAPLSSSNTNLSKSSSSVVAAAASSSNLSTATHGKQSENNNTFESFNSRNLTSNKAIISLATTKDNGNADAEECENSLKLIDAKLTESDAYLQLLIEQLKV